MPPHTAHRALLVAACVCFTLAVLLLPLRINLVALGLALGTLAVLVRG